MNNSEKNIHYYGTPESLPKKHYLTAGNLNVVYENGCLRYVTASGAELIRNIYSAVRDRNWGTIVPVIKNENITQNKSEFHITYTASYNNEEVGFIAEYEISGSADNTISFSMKGKATRTFMKNRIGICILHPLNGVKGKPCKVVHTGGHTSQITFPEIISPVSPVSNIISMDWENEAARCELNFEGDVWEMEDHRNWTDSSYKTYCTPLSIPFPAEIANGTMVNQNVTFKAYPKKENQYKDDVYLLTINDETFPLPSIGTSLNTRLLSQPECDILKEAGFDHLRYDIHFSKDHWTEAFGIAVVNAVILEVPMEVVLHFTSDPSKDLDLFEQSLKNLSPNIKSVWLVRQTSRHTDNQLIEVVLDRLRKLIPDVPVGGGTDAYFAEFNRNRFDASKLDFVTYAICPQVHAFDNDSLVENIAAQADTVESARVLYPGKKVHISPITLRQRFNVVATGEEPPVPNDKLPTQVDPRQMSLFAAGWTLGSLASLIKSGADSITYYEAIGWRGFIQGEEENTKTALFAGRKGNVFPIYHLLRFIHQIKLINVRLCTASHPLKFTGIVLESEIERILCLANHSIDEMSIEIPEIKYQPYKDLSSDNMNDALKNSKFLDSDYGYKTDLGKIIVKPFSICFIRL